jgi:hypothetical protein
MLYAKTQDINRDKDECWNLDFGRDKNKFSTV